MGASTEGSELASGVTVVVPVYRSEDSLAEVVRRTAEVLRGADRSFEIVLVDDCSPDGSWAVIEEIAAEHPEVLGLGLSRNFGQHCALLAGIRTARYDVVVTIDDDLQQRPEDIPILLDALRPGVDLVYGISVEEEHGLWRNLSSRAVKASLGAAVGSEMASKASAFRAFRTTLRTAFESSLDPFISIDVLLSWGTTRFVAVDVEMDQRQFGKSNYTVRKLGRHAINMLTGFSVLPLRIVTLVGFGFAVFGIAVLIYVLISFAAVGSLPGFPFLASLVALFSGAQLFALGVLGEYLGRVHFRSMGRPAYVVGRRAGATAD
jgi:undecaprenyl-phosphate 4-deoxy-4-formamido-L-arabinose transferase